MNSILFRSTICTELLFCRRAPQAFFAGHVSVRGKNVPVIGLDDDGCTDYFALEWVSHAPRSWRRRRRRPRPRLPNSHCHPIAFATPPPGGRCGV